MKAKYLSMAALALMGALASCQSDDDFTVARPDNAVSVNFSVGSLQGTTRSNAIATDDTQRQFKQGDQISVSTNDQEAVIFQCTSTEDQTWAEATANKFLLWTQSTLTFSAYYPVTTGTSMTAFTMPADQSSVDKIALADYMTRQQNISRPEGGSDIQMQLERKMARVIVRISGFGSQYRDDQKTVSNVRIYSEASGIADGNPTGSSTEIQPYAQGDGGQGSTYTALVVPGYGDSGARFIQLTDGEGSTLLVKGIPEMEAGNSYTFNLVVGKNRIEVASVTVQDWTTGEILAGGQAQEELAVPYIGTKSPTEAKAVGDIVFSDGSATAYTSGLTLTDEQKAAAVAVIFYAGSASDILGAKTLGVGLKNTNDETTKYLAFARNVSGNTAEGYNTNITAIQCTPSESGDGKAATATFTGDLDGSDNWTALCAAVNDEGTSGNYPAWEWVNAYATTANLTGEYASGWYLPTVAELCMLYRAKDTVNAALEKADGTKIADAYHWSSSQSSTDNRKAWMVKFDSGKLMDTYKGNNWYVCGVRAFN